MDEIYNKPVITTEDFSRFLNNAVRRMKKFKCTSMEFVAGGGHFEVPEKLYTGLIEVTHMRGFNLYPIKKYGTVTGVLFLKKPCAKFKQLISWINKYSSQGCSDNIETELFTSSICGKRGRWSIEDARNKDYLCHDEAWCDRVKKTLQKIRNTGDRIEVSVDTIEDFENMEESIRNETELYGSITRTLHFSVITPGGKVKFDSVIY